jgi:hypothetical protein
MIARQVSTGGPAGTRFRFFGGVTPSMGLIPSAPVRRRNFAKDRSAWSFRRTAAGPSFRSSESDAC